MKKAIDSLGRRKRVKSDKVVGRQPKGKSITLTDMDLVMFQIMYLFGPLDSRQLLIATTPPRKNLATHATRLTDLYNEPKTMDGGPYLEWPEAQKATLNMRSQHYVYDVNDYSTAALDRKEMLPPHIGRRSDEMQHRYYNASNMFALWDGARKAKIPFINRSEIIAHAGCPQATKDADEPLALPLMQQSYRKKLIPDDLFGLKFNEGVRFHVLETDLQTEPIRRKGKGTSFAEKIAGYIEILENGIAKKQWGISRFSVLTLTGSSRRVQSMVDEVIAHTTHRPKLRDAFLFKVKPHLSAPHWLEPHLMPDLITDPWTTANGPVSINKI